MTQLLEYSVLSALVWYPFVLAVGLTHRHLKIVDVGVDGIAVLAGIAAATAWNCCPASYFMSILAGCGTGLVGGLISAFLMYGLRIHSLLSGIVVSLIAHTLSVVTVGESLVLNDTQLAGDLRGHIGALLMQLVGLGTLAAIFYVTRVGTLIRACASNANFQADYAPALLMTIGLAFSGCVIGVGAAIFVHSEGLARAGGGFEFLLTGLTSFLALERISESLRVRHLRRARYAKSGSSRFLSLLVDVSASVPLVALFGTIVFQVLVYGLIAYAPRPDIWKLALALTLTAGLARPVMKWPFRRGSILNVRKQKATRSGLSVLQLTKSFSSGGDLRCLFRDLSFTFDRGLVLLKGPNGVGKSTLLKVISGYEPVDSGEVHLGGEAVHLLPVHRRRIYLIRQTPHANLAEDLTVCENIVAALGRRASLLRFTNLSRANRALDLLPRDYPWRPALTRSFMLRRTADLSGGEAQCLAITLALLSGARLILADEPTASLDNTNRLGVAGLLASISTDTPVLVATHDSLLDGFSTAILTLSSAGLESVDSLRVVDEEYA